MWPGACVIDWQHGAGQSGRMGEHMTGASLGVLTIPSHPLVAQMRMRTVEELVGAVDGDEWHNLPRWKRIPSLEAGKRS